MSIPLDETLHKDPVLEAMVESQQQICAELASRTARAFEQLGFDMVVIRLAKIARGKDGECAMPGATAIVARPSVSPCLMMEAAEMRRVAEQLEEKFSKSACTVEAHEGYVREGRPEDYGL